MRKAASNLEENKTRLVANYRYKMRESLRSLRSEFSADIFHMSGELDELLIHVEQSHNVKGAELSRVEAEYTLLLQQLGG